MCNRELKTVRYVKGYKLVYVPEHPSAMQSKNWKGWIYEHRLLAEEMLGRPLSEKEDVHHLDGNKANNRKTNLLVLEESQHGKLHKWLDAGAPYGENLRVDGVNSENAKVSHSEYANAKKAWISSENSDCAVCGKTLQNTQKMYCSNKCAGIGSRKAKTRPTKEELKELIDSTSMVKIGKMFGVSDNAVRKWAKAYGLLSQP